MEVDNLQRFERMEQTILSTNSSLAKIVAAIDAREAERVGTSSIVDGGPSVQLNTPPPHTPQQLTPQRTPFQVRSVKLDFPRFDGKNVASWIFKAQQFFDYYNTPDSESLTIASVHLDQEIVPWYQMMQKVNPFQRVEPIYSCNRIRFWSISL